jgi:hypothetical protein
MHDYASYRAFEFETVVGSSAFNRYGPYVHGTWLNGRFSDFDPVCKQVQPKTHFYETTYQNLGSEKGARSPKLFTECTLSKESTAGPSPSAVR